MTIWRKFRWHTSLLFAMAWLLQSICFIFLFGDHISGLLWILGLGGACVLPLVGMNVSIHMSHGCATCGKLALGIWCATCQYRQRAVERVYKWQCACSHAYGSHNVLHGCCSDWCPCERFTSVDGLKEPSFVHENQELMEASMMERQCA